MSSKQNKRVMFTKLDL